ALEPAGRLVAQQLLAQPIEERPLLDRLLVVAVLGQALDLGALDRHGALVLVDAAAAEYADVHHRAGHARRQLQRRVAYVRGLFAEDRPQQLLFRGHRAFALRRHLAHQDVARIHLGADIDDAGLVQVLQSLFTDVRDVAGDFL